MSVMFGIDRKVEPLTGYGLRRRPLPRVARQAGRSWAVELSPYRGIVARIVKLMRRSKPTPHASDQIQFPQLSSTIAPPLEQSPISLLKKGDRHLAAALFPQSFDCCSEPVPVFQQAASASG